MRAQRLGISSDNLYIFAENNLLASAFILSLNLSSISISLNAFQVAMHTTSNYGNARLKRIDTERIKHELESRKIVIVTGFQGINKYSDMTTLGRGGSDTSAVAIAAKMHAMLTAPLAQSFAIFPYSLFHM